MKKAFLLLAGLVVMATATAASVDLEKSTLKWTGKKVTGEHWGNVKIQDGSVDLKDGKLAGGNFVVDMSSISVGDLEGEWADKLKGHLTSDDFFSVEKFKTSTLKIKTAKQNKDGSYDVVADLTIKEKTHPVKFNATMKEGTFAGKVTFDRTKFDIKYNSGSFFKDLGDKMINDEVSLDFTVAVK